jgi:hypothetical protein
MKLLVYLFTIAFMALFFVEQEYYVLVPYVVIASFLIGYGNYLENNRIN